jgi:hypothetical protein
MVHPENKASVEWVPSNDPVLPLIRVWRGVNNDGAIEECREYDSEKDKRQEIAALFDMGWHQS